MKNLNKLLAGYMVANGLVETWSSVENYNNDDLADLFGLSIEYLEENHEDIMNELYEYNDLLGAIYDQEESDNDFDLTFYTDYCPSYEEESEE